jgi:hypothetical protein
VIQFNKRDLPDCLPEEEIRRSWGPTGIPVLMASALGGVGVTETFAALAGLVYQRIDLRYALGEQHGLCREEFVRRLTTVHDTGEDEP